MTRPDRRMLVPLALALTLAVAGMGATGAALAAPTDPVTLTSPPEDQGAAFVPGVRELPLPDGWVEEEYLVSGAATVYNYAHNPPLGPTDITPLEEDVPYTTRIIIRRPENRGHFNGSVTALPVLADL